MWDAIQRLRREQRMAVILWAVLLLLWLLLGWWLGPPGAVGGEGAG